MRSAIHAPIDEPTSTKGGAQTFSVTASASPSQREIVPARKSPPDRPWPE
jgi:hypothetical protein